MENLGKVVLIIIVSILFTNKFFDKNCSTIYSMHFETARAYLQKVVMYSGYLHRT
jgi:hypothetical protein